MSDNGASLTPYIEEYYDHHQNSIAAFGIEAQLVGEKESLYEGGHRVPFFWHWPEKLAPRVDTTNTVTYTDVYATMADIIGVDLGCNEAPDSRSMTPLLFEKEGWENGIVLHHGVVDDAKKEDYSVAIREGDFKYHNGMLFNIAEDLEEKNDLSGVMPEKAAEMKKKLVDSIKAVDDRERETDIGRGSCLAKYSRPKNPRPKNPGREEFRQKTLHSK